VLKVLLDEKAFDSDHRMTTEVIAAKAAGGEADANQFKGVVSELKSLQYVDTREGRSGGVWLTTAGRSRSEKL
jgi:DNA-binding IscR family transcriptional regulator